MSVDDKKTKLFKIEAKLSPAKRKIWEDIKEGLKVVELIEEGKIKGKSSKDLLEEL